MTRRHRGPSPGQLTLSDAALLTVILPTGRALVLLPGGLAGRAPSPTPIPTALAVTRKAAA